MLELVGPGLLELGGIGLVELVGPGLLELGGIGLPERVGTRLPELGWPVAMLEIAGATVTARELLVFALAFGGVCFAVVAAVSLVRLPDLYTRAHGASKSETLGAILTLGAVALSFDAGLSTVKVVLLLVFMFITNPTAAHAIARAAADQGIEPWTTEDDDA